MTTRTCPSCARQAHSADDTSPWDCPYCGERIPVPTESHSAVIDAETRNSINFAIGWMPFWWGSKFNKRLVQKRLRGFYKEVQDERD